jgi:hypothetical protein
VLRDDRNESDQQQTAEPAVEKRVSRQRTVRLLGELGHALLRYLTDAVDGLTSINVIHLRHIAKDIHHKCRHEVHPSVANDVRQDRTGSPFVGGNDVLRTLAEVMESP